MLSWLRKAPVPVVVAVIAVCGFGFAAVLAAFVVLEINGEDTADFRAFVNTLANLIMLPLVGVGTVAATAAARSAAATEEHTNGHLAAKEKKIDQLQQTLDYERRHGGS